MDLVGLLVGKYLHFVKKKRKTREKTRRIFPVPLLISLLVLEVT